LDPFLKRKFKCKLWHAHST